jgi:maltose O-acetyltransferase
VSIDKQLMFAGEPYNPQAPQLLAERLRSRVLCERFNTIPFADAEPRRAVLRELLGAIAQDAEIMAPFNCDYGYRITIGARTFLNYGVVVLDAAEVRIGADVQVGPSVQLITALHPLDADERVRGTETAAAVVIEDRAWLATGVIVCPGVTIGERSVIGAGSVVTRDQPAGHVCLGAPCRPIRQI